MVLKGEIKMSLDNVNLFQAMNQKMDWLGQRQKVLAKNVANADTPDYIPSDLKDFSFRNVMRNGSSSNTGSIRTNEKHIDFSKENSGGAVVSAQDHVYETAPDGNGVIIEEQMLKASQTAAEYQTVTNLYKKHYDMMMMIIKAQ